jgi:hypothetical protein
MVTYQIHMHGVHRGLFLFASYHNLTSSSHRTSSLARICDRPSSIISLAPASFLLVHFSDSLVESIHRLQVGLFDLVCHGSSSARNYGLQFLSFEDTRVLRILSIIVAASSMIKLEFDLIITESWL